MRRAGAILAAAMAAALAAPGAAAAATIEVDLAADELSDPAPGAGCSLREAAQAASSDAVFGGCPAGSSGAPDSILLDPGVTYALTRAAAPEDLNAFGDLDLDTADGVTIARDGAGARATIDANDLELSTSVHDRAIDLSGDGAFTLDGVRVVDGDAGLQNGGAVRWAAPATAGALTVTDSELAGNFGGTGSAISADITGPHLIEDSLIRDGLASNATVYSGGELTVVRSTLSGNSGGGLFAGGTGPDALSVDSSAIVGNDIGADNSIGAIRAEGDAEVVNSTISGNVGGFVGGIEAHSDLTVSFTTIADNLAPNAGGNASGGIDAISADAVSVDASVLAGNMLGTGAMNCNQALDADLRPSLESANTCGLQTAGPEPSLVNAAAELAPVADNGGPTPTRGLYPESQALGLVPSCGPGASDQRGVARPDDDCDAGAFQGTVARPPPPPPQTEAPSAATGSKKKTKKKKKCKRKGKRGKRKRCAKKRSAAASGAPTVIGRSAAGRPIRARRIGTPGSDRVALVVGVIHGDERAGLAVTRELRRIGDGIKADVWVIDSINPDGARARTRRNARGVDLNRNFPFKWRGGVPRWSGYYPGPRPASEPETRAAMALAKRIEPDVSIWYHQPWGAVLACGGRPAAGARYAKLAGMRTSCRGNRLRGTAVTWEQARIAGAEAFVVELPAGRTRAAAARRHARAAARVAEGIR